MQALVGPAEASLYNVPLASSVPARGWQRMWGWSRCEASAEAAHQVICRDIRGEAMCEVPYYPLGHYLQPSAYRSNLTGLLEGFATFWSVRRG